MTYSGKLEPAKAVAKNGAITASDNGTHHSTTKGTVEASGALLVHRSFHKTVCSFFKRAANPAVDLGATCFTAHSNCNACCDD